MSEFFRRIHYLLTRRRSDRELVADMEFHQEMAARHGQTAFGNTLRLREEARDAWGWTWIDRLAQDLRFSARTMRRSPGFTLAAVLMLAIGIGANVAAFGFFDLIELRPLNIRAPQTLLRFHRRGLENFAYSLPYPEMAFLREHTRTLSAMLGLNITTLSIDGETSPVQAHFVSTNFFSELGGVTVLGRPLDSVRDSAAGAEPAVVLSYGFWRRHFGGDPLAVGRVIHLNGKPAVVAGIASPDFSGLSLNNPDIWLPLVKQPYFVAGSLLLTDYSMESSGVQTWGRLAPGYSPKAAEQELKSLAAQLRSLHPSPIHPDALHPDAIWDKEALLSEPGGYASSLIIGNRRGSGGEGRNEIYPIFGLIAALVLLILAVACGNLGSLLLARGVARERELSIRTAVGAGRARLIRQLLTESLALALLGAVAGLATGWLVLRGLLLLTGAPPWLDASPDWRIVVFSAAIGLVAAVLFGLTPALQPALQKSIRRRHYTSIPRQVLVAAQVAASCVLLIVAGLLTRALNHAMTADPGFRYQRVLSIDPGLSAHGYSPAQARVYLDTLEARLTALPGVESVALTITPPLGHVSIGAGVDIEGRHVSFQISPVDRRFFPTMEIPLLRGRNFAPGELNGAIVSEAFARTAFPGVDALGHKLTVGDDFVVVGIAGNARTTKIEDSDSLQTYFPLKPADLPSTQVLVRTFGPVENFTSVIAARAHEIDPLCFPEVQLLSTGFQSKLKSAEYSAATVSVLGSIADILACLGIAGVVAYAVSQRAKEIGIRMALGANPSHVLAVVLRQFLIPVASGLSVGMAGAVALSGLLRSQLFGIHNLDPAAYIVALALFAVTAALAAIWPARRALRVDPLLALRYE